MNQKGFANIILVVLVVVLFGALGYVTLLKKPASTEQSQLNNSKNTEPTTPSIQTPPQSKPDSVVNPQLELQVNFKKAGQLLGNLDSAWGYNGRFVNKLASDIHLQSLDFEFLPKSITIGDLPQFVINTWYPRFLYDQPPPYPNFEKYTQAQPVSLAREKDLGNGVVRYKLAKPLVIPSEDRKSGKKHSTFLILTADKWININEIRIVGVRVDTGDGKSTGAKLVIGFPDFPDMVSRVVDYIAFYKDRTWFPDRDWIDNGKQ